jgi:predicted homoserine dehydrogenase-like protein
MLQELKQREKQGRPINVGLTGLGSMGLGIAYQIGRTPGMRLSFVADYNEAAARNGAKVYGKPTNILKDCMAALENPNIPCDVLVEATNSIVAAHDHCMAAIQRKAHCVLMNAEVDLVLGYLLRAAAAEQNVIVTSDAGDQHGVLARMMEEIEMLDFDIVQAGNMKGFLDRHQTLEGIEPMAKKLELSSVQCLAYTDGSKLNIEMSIIANEYGLTPFIPGMEGPRANRVQDVTTLFDFDKYGRQGCVDYILGAQEHASGVYVVGKCDTDFQQRYLNYYKMTNKHPYYVFFRPYHLCHFETPRAIALAALYGKAVCTMRRGRVTDTFAYAKKDLKSRDKVQHAIGGNEIYGLIDEAKKADPANHVPQGVLVVEGEAQRPVIKRTVKKDQPITWDDIEIPENRMTDLWEKQKSLLGLI